MPTSSRWACVFRWLRIAACTLLVLLALFLLLLTVHKGLLPLLAVFLPQLESTFYDLAVYGVYRTRDYVSFDASSPRVNIVQWNDPACDQGHIFLGLYGDSVPAPGPTILDAQGELVWFTEEFGQVTNFQMQSYRGQNYLTFWAGRKVGGVGQGALYMLDSSYQVVRRIHAVGDHMWGDLHEFQITPEGTALISVYNKTTADLRHLGWFRGKDGWISDCIFQEIDIETGELLFQWAASDHVRPERTYYTQPFSGFIPAAPFDYFHLNSIEKDSRGNYLISSRHFHTITYISGATGAILWELGGDSTDFTDLSDGDASSFKWQHHARWLSEEDGLLTLFDNGLAGPLHVDARTSKAVILQLDTNNMTATHVRSFYPTSNVLSSSQGSVQTLPDGRLFTGWGSSGLWTEHAEDGTLLCEVHFGASIVYAWEWVKSYRSFKAWGWVGRPQYPPDTRIVGDQLFVSWNGATEVCGWRLEGRRIADQGGNDLRGIEEFEIVDELPKLGFEAVFSLPTDIAYSDFRVAALDVDGAVLRFSHPLQLEDVPSSFWRVLLGLFFLGVGTLGGISWFVRLYPPKRRSYAILGDNACDSIPLSSSPPPPCGASRAATAVPPPWDPKSIFDFASWGRAASQYRYSKL